MRLESISSIAELVGMNRATVSKRLKAAAIEPREGPKGATLYPCPEALRVLFIGEAGELDPRTERALLDRSKREHQEMQNAKLRGDLVPVGDIEAEWESLIGTIRAGMLAVPSRAAPELMLLQDEKRVEDALTRHIHEAMQMVADSGEGG